jgi:ribosomal protein S27E
VTQPTNGGVPHPPHGDAAAAGQPYQQPAPYGHDDYAPQAPAEPNKEDFKDATWDQVKETRRQESEAGYAPGEAPEIVYEEHDGPSVIETQTGGKDGLVRCAKCGSTDIGFSVAKASLYCNFCRFEWQSESAVDAYNLNTPVHELRGIHIGSGSAEIIPDVSQIVSFKCSACGAEVVIDTEHAMQARCHWCRHTLSVQEQIPNGAVPDAVLPFSLPKEVAMQNIQKFVDSRKFFALRKFKQEFKAENVMGVYLPYMIVDVNARMHLQGVGEEEIRRYTVGTDDNKRTVYDVDVYSVARQFDVQVDDLTLESSSEKGNIDNSKNTNNIINSIMPFDTKNIVRFNPNYLSGFSSQKRDTNIDGLAELAHLQSADIGRHLVRPSLKKYDRGVRWDQENLDVIGERWISAYLPVWLYSYYEKKSNGNELLHYIAVNGRTGETMGSIPVNMGRLFAAACVAEVFGIIATILVW